ncbi:hypothetical protein, partial [Mycolicibacterium iranicum]|uniref:hypothetical protein n=1 Tax=Mycolicibacterium iranicum TaxID=912594 RepID=UPI001A968479
MDKVYLPRVTKRLYKRATKSSRCPAGACLGQAGGSIPGAVFGSTGTGTPTAGRGGGAFGSGGGALGSGGGGGAFGSGGGGG